MQDEKTAKWFDRHGLTPPTHISHEVNPDNLADKLRPLRAKKWRLEGNRLVAETAMGEVVNYIDPGVIMTGVDEDNLPIFKRI